MASESTTASYNNPFRRKSSTPNGFVGAPALGAVPAPIPSAPANAEASISHSGNATKQQTPTHSAGDFAKALQALGKSDAPPPPSTTFQRKKPIKKVRVQSPPPSSPESASAERTYPKYPLPERDEGDESSSVSSESLDGEREDPFQNEAPPIFEDALASMARSQPVHPQPQPQSYSGRGPPPNPFGRTLEDIEQAAQSPAQQSAPIGKAGLDVEAFKRLLLTGQGPAPGAAGTSNTPSPSRHTGIAADGGSVTDASSISRHSLFGANHIQETPRTSHENSEPEGNEYRSGLISPPQPNQSARKKPPPPPATRHGKLIKVELGQKETDKPAALDRRSPGGPASTLPTSPGQRYSVSPVGVNKPLPPPPARSEDDPKESIFDKEAAGKVPEIDIDPDTDVAPPPRPPTPPNTSHSSSTPMQNPASTLRKPAPPPRRHSHARTDSKHSDTAEEAGTPPRTSLDSNLSRSSSLRLNTAVPTPPPPRRPAAHRNSPSISGTISSSLSPAFPFPTVSASPTSNVPSLLHGSPHSATEASSGAASSSTPVSPQQSAGAKPSPPPRPPQRNTSLRKSVGSFPSRHVSASSPEQSPRKSGAIPPPPPPRTRVSSKGSMDGPGNGLSRTSIDGSRQVSGEGATATPNTSSKVATVVEGKEMTDGVDTSVTDDAVKAMLADLEALQREVEAARAAAAGTAGGGS
ncbi:hypothetical protein VPNG_10094 [Cytospora leucostoma]|uniref:DZF domain-containing protein n=1 Tax=Cytospora leucostoma TaxID=1230097 RepID=A0A423VIX2_9PEZI|nr:hypothetical protein VPNG_10094 [Cytospora leucostoma]